jgi:outer membrane protein TolC
MALNNAMGLDVNSPTDVESPQPELDIADDARALIEKAYTRRPEFKQLALGRRQAEIGGKMSKLLPSGGVVGFQGSYALLNEGSTFGQQDSWQLAIGADIPMYDSGLAHNKVRQSAYTVEKLDKQKKQLKEYVALQVNEAYLSMNEAKARVDTSSAILAQAEEAVRMAETGYEEGVTTNIDVIDAQPGQLVLDCS